MAPERMIHLRVKYLVAKALEAAIAKAGLKAEMLTDGATVRINDYTAYEPDALVYEGPRLAPDEIIVSNPVIITEVASPSNSRIDLDVKYGGYFLLPSLHHYLIVLASKRMIIHHSRGVEGVLLTKIIREGEIVLDPPGLMLQFSDILPSDL